MSGDEELVRERRRRARARVKLPAGFMLLMSVFGSCFALAFLYLSLTDDPKPQSGWGSLPFAWAIPTFGLLWCGFIGYGAWEMDRLGNYQVARAAAVVAVVPVPVPAYLFWLIGAILGIIALNDPAVRAAFASGNGAARAVYLEDHGDRLRRQMERRRSERD
jgi:hypothetical protein